MVRSELRASVAEQEQSYRHRTGKYSALNSAAVITATTVVAATAAVLRNKPARALPENTIAAIAATFKSSCKTPIGLI